MQGRRLGQRLVPVVLFLWWTSSSTLAASPVLVAFVVDASGTVKNYDRSRMRDLAPDLLRQLPVGSEMAVFVFKERPKLLLPRTSDAAGIEVAIGELTIRKGRAVLIDALYDAGKYLRDQPGPRKAIVVVCGGRDDGSVLLPKESLDLVQAAGIPVFTIGTPTADRRGLEHIAQATGGEYMPLREASGYLLASKIQDVLAAAAPMPTPRLVAEPPAPEPEPRPWTVIAGIILGVLLACALLVWAILLRSSRRTGAYCPRCAAPLPAVGAPCQSCTLAFPAEPPVPPQPISTPADVIRFQPSALATQRLDTRRGRLLIQDGKGMGNVFEVPAADAIVIGRSAAAEVRLDDLAVSQQHCRIQAANGSFLLRDLKSTNGTFVNSLKVAEHALEDGNLIRIGETTLLFRIG